MAKRRTNKETKEGVDVRRCARKIKSFSRTPRKPKKKRGPKMRNKDWRLVIDLLLVLGLIWLLYMISK